MGKRKAPTKTDEDGDLLMDSKPHARDRINKIRERGNRDVKTSRSPVRSQLSSQVAQREILRQLGSTVKRREAPQRSNHQRHVKDLTVTGWEKSKAALNEDGGVSDVVAFLERRSTMNMAKWAMSRGTNARSPVKIKKYSVHDDGLHITVSADEAPSLLRLDGYAFAGANIGVKSASGREQPSSLQNQQIEEPNYKQLLQQVLSRRYNPETKLLDLSNLGRDSDLNAAGVFNAATTQSKLFPALMKLCDNQFKSSEEKRETVQSVTLADNALQSVTPVTTLAQTFPDLQNLDLSNNLLSDLNSLLPWRHKFRHLKLLVLSGNPIESNSPGFASEITKWYRSLRLLNGIEVRSAETEQEEIKKSSAALAILPPHFQDEGQIAETFLKNFFLGFDNDRSGLVSYYYDADSQFSLSINTKALRDPSSSANLTLQRWDAYIKRSRNLKKVTQLPARLSRNYCGSEAVREVFLSLPGTLHPSLSDEPQKWLIECITQPGIPDQTGQSDAGVGGFLIIIHGEFTELQNSDNTDLKKRSFDRTFVLGPGGPNGVRIVSEMWTLRAYGGFDMFRAAVPSTNVQASETGRNSMVEELSRITGMKLDFSRQCLEESGWNPEKAVVTFEAAKATLPKEVFLT